MMMIIIIIKKGSYGSGVSSQQTCVWAAPHHICYRSVLRINHYLINRIQCLSVFHSCGKQSFPGEQDYRMLTEPVDGGFWWNWCLLLPGNSHQPTQAMTWHQHFRINHLRTRNSGCCVCCSDCRCRVRPPSSYWCVGDCCCRNLLIIVSCCFLENSRVQIHGWMTGRQTKECLLLCCGLQGHLTGRRLHT